MCGSGGAFDLKFSARDYGFGLEDEKQSIETYQVDIVQVLCRG